MTRRPLIIVLAALLIIGGVAANALAGARFAVFSDPHYYDSDLGTSGAAFEAYLTQDRKLLRESEALVQAVVNAIITENLNAPIDFVIVPGDLTKDGELDSHQEFAEYLEQLEAEGIRVYVVPGNHDINNPHAYAYDGPDRTPVVTVSPARFAEIYAPFGYDEAFSRDIDSLSYVVEPVPGIVLLALDSCQYDDNLSTGYPKTGGAFSQATLQWAVAQIEAAKKAGKQVMGFLHHGLLEHYSGQATVFADFVVDDWESVSETLAFAGLKLVFTGHYHANDITRRTWAAEGIELVDVETGSLSTSPCPYRMVTLHGHNAARIETRRITEIEYDTAGVPFTVYAAAYIYEGLYNLAMYTLTQPVDLGGYGLDTGTAAYLAPKVADAFAAHYAGDEQPTAQTMTQIEGFMKDPNPVLAQLGTTLYALWTDLPPTDGRALLSLDPAIALKPLGTYASGIFNQGAAEIAAYDAGTRRLFVSNADANTLDVLDAGDPSNPALLFTIDLSPYGGGVNSVAVQRGIAAVAVEAHIKQDPGKVVFFHARTGQYLNQVAAGALPDMLMFTPDGRKVLVANEGEPSDDYQVDPEGSVTIIDISRGVRRVKTRTAGFARFNARKAELVAAGVRIFGPGATVAQDLEPEYITVAHGSRFAWVSLQENNAVARLDLLTGRITDVIPLGFKDFGLPENGFDASNKDDGINIKPHDRVFGMFQPDAIAAYRSRGRLFLVTANEGDSRDYDAFSEEERVADVSLDPVVFPDAATLQEKAELGRLNITTTLGDVDADGDFDRLFAYGGRSFSIFKPTRRGLELVFDSADQLEQITAAALPADFNANNDENGSFDSRSDDKGPEPEGLTIGSIRGRTYLFLGLERIGGIVVYDISRPRNPVFVQYINTRDFSGDSENGTAGDLGPEGLTFIPACKSPIGKNMLAVANEVSGTTTLYQIHVARCGYWRDMDRFPHIRLVMK